jgi:hypothetical protein
MRRANQAIFGFSLLFSHIFVAAPALGNGRFPSAQHVVVGPSGRSEVIALRATFGVMLSTDSGATFHWMCEESLFFPFVQSTNFDAPIEISAGARLVWGYEDGIRYTDSACNSVQVADTSSHVFADLAATPTGDVIYGIESGQGVRNAVYRGTGDSLRFTRMGAGINQVIFDTIEVSPSDPMRVYVSGRDTNTFLPILYRSNDGGSTLTPVTTDLRGADSLWISGVDFRNADMVYARANVGLTTELRRSLDGGVTWRTLVTTRDPMLGFALSDDGNSIWVGSIAEGLLRSTDRGDSFRQVNRLPVMCLRSHAESLWACSDWINQPFALGRSRDGGQTFEPVLQFSSGGSFQGPPETCSVRSEGAQICIERWPILQRMLVAPPDPSDGGLPDVVRRDATTDRTDASRSDATMDANDVSVAMDVRPVFDATIVPPVPRTTCGCTVVGLRENTQWKSLVALAVLATCARRRKRP